MHISADIGCHSFATFAPFNQGNSILGYGMSLASAAAVSRHAGKRADQRHGRRRLLAQRPADRRRRRRVQQGRRVLVIMKNGYTTATGRRTSSPATEDAGAAAASGLDIEAALKSMGVKWMRPCAPTTSTECANTLREAFTHRRQGPEGDHRRRRMPARAPAPHPAGDRALLAAGERVVRTRFGVDEEVCTGDHSCIRLSGCPSLTIKPSEDPLRTDPGRPRQQRLRGLRAVRRGRARGAALPVVRADRHHPEPDLVGPAEAAGIGSVHAAARRREQPRRRSEIEPEARTGGVTSWVRQSPSTVLIAALGGEGGGVLASWLHRSAIAAGHFVQGTSIPGVAQRTGRPHPAHASGDDFRARVRHQ